jgi:hypothetical protein
MLSYHPHQCLPSGLSPSGFLTKVCTYFSSAPCMPHALFISSSLTWSHQ